MWANERCLNRRKKELAILHLKASSNESLPTYVKIDNHIFIPELSDTHQIILSENESLNSSDNRENNPDSQIIKQLEVLVQTAVEDSNIIDLGSLIINREKISNQSLQGDDLIYKDGNRLIVVFGEKVCDCFKSKVTSLLAFLLKKNYEEYKEELHSIDDLADLQVRIVNILENYNTDNSKFLKEKIEHFSLKFLIT